MEAMYRGKPLSECSREELIQCIESSEVRMRDMEESHMQIERLRNLRMANCVSFRKAFVDAASIFTAVALLAVVVMIWI